MTRVGVSAVVVVHHHRLLGRFVDPIDVEGISLSWRKNKIRGGDTNEPGARRRKVSSPASVVTRRALSLSFALCTKLVPYFSVFSECLKFMTNIFRLNFGGIF